MRKLFPENNIIKKLKDGKTPVGTFSYLRDASVMDLIATAGMDYVIIDTEHAVKDLETVERQIITAQLGGITPLVRVPKTDAPLIRRYLEMGAQGILVPHIQNKEDCLAAQDAMRYPPKGHASTCRTIRSAAYDAGNYQDYLSWVDRASLIALIEDPEAMENLDEIMETLEPGRDMVMFGKADFSQSLGIIGKSGSVESNAVEEADEKVAEACRERGLPFLIVPSGMKAEAIAKDVKDKNTVLCLGIDQSILLNVYRDAVRECEKVAEA